MPATEVGGNSLGAVTPGETLGTLYTSGVGTNKTKQHTNSSSMKPNPIQLTPAELTEIATAAL